MSASPRPSKKPGLAKAAAQETASDDQAPLDINVMPGHLIRRMHQASQAIFDIEMARIGADLTSMQFAALNRISAQSGLDQATLAALLAFDRATTGGVIDRLEAKGLVRREVDRMDRRARKLFLEPAGREMLRLVSGAVVEAQSAMLAGLAEDEQAQFLKLLEKAIARVGDLARPGQRERVRSGLK